MYNCTNNIHTGEKGVTAATFKGRNKHCLWEANLVFLYVDIWFGMTKRKFIVKKSSFKILVVFSLIFVADKKITFVYNFVAPLTIHINVNSGHSGLVPLLITLNTFYATLITLNTTLLIFYVKTYFKLTKETIRKIPLIPY